MKHIEGTFKGFRGLDLYYQSWHPETQSQAIVVLVHGLGGHSGLFEPLVQYLVSQQNNVYAFDLRGHGHSPGRRGYIHDWQEFREDLRAFLDRIFDPRSRCPCFLWGHSLGGTIALDYALHYPEGLQGLVVTAPALGKVRISPLKLGLGKLLSQIWPQFSLKLGIKNEACSRDPKICDAFAHDPLRHEYGTARLATEFFDTVAWIENHTADLKVPLLTLHGGADQVTVPAATRDFFHQVVFPDKEYREYPEHYHDLYVDIDYQVVFKDFQNWLERHLQGNLIPNCIPSCNSGVW